ncbi:TonB-dependent receptor domain-containing protein [Rufibacter sediminis]|uniref:TonB-dependent receptor n=1 Tax=Rufibacter sediminis TaxID=2762756 RepID=A0ABR6VM48_9BACT|nr:TonB-dependent receptor [Rufibacter sediminis]MBC3538243.1 TonB-dependent receptor [Rufibacter sediminis]
MKSILSLLLVVVPLAATAQSAVVQDRATLQPLAGVRVVPTQGGPALLTDAKGRFSTRGFQDTDSLRFDRADYKSRTLAVNQLKTMQYRVLLSERSYSLDEVVVSASKFEEKRADVPQQIQVLKARELAFQSNQTTADVLQQTGQVLVQKSQAGGGSPILRGFEANKVLMVIDGVRLNNAIYRGGHLQNVITVDNASLEKVEVVFGPGSVVYGSDALGGVIHFYTKNPVLGDSAGTHVTGSAFTRYATANQEKTGHADFSIGGRKWGSFTSFTYSDFDDLRQGKNRNPFYGNWGLRPYFAQRVNGEDVMVPNANINVQKFSGYKQYDVLQKVLFQPSATTSHLLNVQFSTSSDIPRYDRLTEVDAQGRLNHGEWYYGPQERWLAAYTFATKGRGWLEDVRVTAAYQSVEESRHNRRFNRSPLQSRFEHVDVYTLNADASRLLGEHELRYGLEGTYNEVSSRAYGTNLTTGERTPLDTRYPSGGSDMRTAAAYFTHTWEISPRWILSDGVRVSRVELNADFSGDKTFFPFPFDAVSQKNTAVNGNLGLVFQPGREWRFAAVASSGFRAPNVDDLAKVFESTAGQLVVPNPNLKPEYTYNAELSIGKTVAQSVRVEGTGFYTWYRDAITTQPFTFQGQNELEYNGQLSRVVASVNANKAYVYGVTGSVNADLTQAFRLASTLTYTYGRIQSSPNETPLDHIPPVYGKTSLFLTLPKFRSEFFVQYNGWKHLEDYNPVGEDNLQYATPQGVPAWYTLNLRTAYQFHPRLQFQAALENITDQFYRVYASGVSAPGRNLVLTLRGNF